MFISVFSLSSNSHLMRCYEQVGFVFIRFLGVKIDSVTLWCFEGFYFARAVHTSLVFISFILE